MMIRRVTILILWLAFVSHGAFAQTTTGTISGVVRDETGGVLPGVTVAIKHVDTGSTRTLVTDDHGAYRAPNLSLGAYQLEAALAGFQTATRTGIELTIGRAAVVDFTLTIGDITEMVQVTSEAALVNTTGSSVAGLVSEGSISKLPLSGRDFVQLALLEPNVLRVMNSDNTIAKGFGTRTTFAGSRPRQNIFLMDGSNVNNMTNFGVPGSVAGVIMGVDTVREFQVLVGSYAAEYAGSGGTLNAVTKAGTNVFHGTGFWLTRNDSMDAKNFFDREKPDFSRHQYGATLGGPVWHDRLFFFGAYEGLRDDLGVTVNGVVPDENARLGLLPDPRNPGQLLNVGVHPAIRPYLDLNPMPNGRSFGDGTAEYVWSQTEPTRQNYVVGKLDYRYGDSNSLFGRYTLDNSNALKTLDLPLFESSWKNRNDWLTVENRTLLSARTFFVFRFGFVRSDTTGDDIVARGQSFDDSLALVPGQPLGPISYVPARDNRAPRLNTGSSLQYTGQLVLERGNHSMKLGADFIHYLYNFTSVSYLAGNYSFSSLSNFLQNKPRQLQIRISDSDILERRIRMLVGGFYVQDDIRLTDRFTANLGVRYEPYSVPKEVQGLESVLRDPMDPEFTVGSSAIRNPSWKNFGPRVGFAWDLKGNGRMVVRGGGGVYHDILLPLIYRNVFSNSPPYSNVLTVDNPVSFPNALEDLKLPGRPALINPDGITWDVNQPRLYQANLQFEAQLSDTLVVNVGYVGSRGNNQVRMLDAHTVAPDTLPDGSHVIPVGRTTRRNPNFAGSWWRVTDAQSFYDGLRAKLTKRFSGGLTFGVAYTLGKAIDDSSTDVGYTDFQSNSSLPGDPDNRRGHRGLSNFDTRHNLVVNFSALVPWGQDLSGVGSALLAGWEVNSIVTLATGQPFAPIIGFDNAGTRSRAFTQRPSLNPAYSNNPILGGPDQYFDPMAFDQPPARTFGNVGRNTMIGPGLALVDLALVKQMAMAGERRLEIRLEMFNLLNRANFSIPNIIVFDASGRVGNAGRITRTSTAARQVQIGLKFVF